MDASVKSSAAGQDAARKQLVAALARIAGGDRQALQFLYRETSAKLFAVCHRILHDKGEAEDVLQEAYIAIWRHADAFDPNRASPISWLVAIARNRSIDRLRSGAIAARQRTMDEIADVSDSAPTALAQLESSEEHRLLMDCLDTLEPQHASVVRSAFFDGVTYEELARRSKIPLGTMKSWIRRSLQRLRNTFLASVAAATLALCLICPPSSFAQSMGEKTVMVGGAAMYPSKNIIQNAVNSKDHTTLVAAVKAAGLVDTLQGPGPFTVFAPTNEAFAQLPKGTVESLLKPENKDKLVKILTYHVVSADAMSNAIKKMIKDDGGKHTITTVSGGKLVAMMNGDKIMLTDENGGVATVTIANVKQSNGVIHVVDHVLLPK